MTYITAAFPENVWKTSNAFFSKIGKPKLCRFCTEPFNSKGHISLGVYRIFNLAQITAKIWYLYSAK